MVIRLYDRLYPIPEYMEGHSQVRTIFVTDIVESFGRHGVWADTEEGIVYIPIEIAEQMKEAYDAQSR